MRPGTSEEYRKRFERFHQQHPEVYRHIVRRTRDDLAAGRRPGIRRIWEDTRAELGVRMNDHMHAYYARLVMKKEPDLAGVFRTRHRSKKN